MEYILSVGLNVGDSEPADQLSATLYQLAIRADGVRDVKMGAAEWQGTPERFVQARAESNTPYVAAQGMALDLQQEAIAVLHKGDPYWYLVYADGRVLPGASVKDFPVILGAALETAAESSQDVAPISIGKLDDRPHGAVQAWSRGPIFPFVIVRTEVDEFPTWRAINGPGGAQTSSYFSYDACERAAMDHLQAMGAGRG